MRREYVIDEEGNLITYDSNKDAKDNKRVARNNMLIDIIQERLSDPDTQYARFKPSGFPDASIAAKGMRELLYGDMNTLTTLFSKSANTTIQYEVSTQGDERFSAFRATFKGDTTITLTVGDKSETIDVSGKTIEYAWQVLVKKSQRGKVPSEESILHGQSIEVSKVLYRQLWEEFFKQNPELEADMHKILASGRILNDKFAGRASVNQADAITSYMKEKYKDLSTVATNNIERLHQIVTQEDWKDPEPNYDPTEPSTLVYYNQQNQLAAKLIGIFANDNTNAALCSLFDKFELKQPITLFGKTRKDLLHPTNPQEVMDAIHQLIAASVDAVKDPVLNYLNLNTLTASSGALLIRLGYTYEEVGVFLNQPIIREACELAYNEGIDIGTALSNVENKYLKGLDSSITENLEEEVKKVALLPNFMVGNILNYRKKGNAVYENFDYLKGQLQVAMTFYKILGAANSLTNFTLATKSTASSSVVSTFGDMFSNLQKINKALDTLNDPDKSPFVFNIRGENNAIGSKSPYNPFSYESTAFIANWNAIYMLANTYFPYGRKLYTQMRLLLQDLSKSNNLTGEILNTAYHDFMVYILSSQPNSLFNGKTEVNVADLGFERNETMAVRDFYLKAFPYIMMDILQNPGAKEHPLLSKLSYDIIQEEEGGSQKALLRIDSSEGMAPEIQQGITEGWLSLWKTDPHLAEGLFYYCYYTTGFQTSAFSFINYAPAEMKENLLPNLDNSGISYIDFLQGFLTDKVTLTKDQVEEFGFKFIRNHPKLINKFSIHYKDQKVKEVIDSFTDKRATPMDTITIDLNQLPSETKSHFIWSVEGEEDSQSTHWPPFIRYEHKGKIYLYQCDHFVSNIHDKAMPYHLVDYLGEDGRSIQYSSDIAEKVPSVEEDGGTEVTPDMQPIRVIEELPTTKEELIDYISRAFAEYSFAIRRATYDDSEFSERTDVFRADVEKMANEEIQSMGEAIHANREKYDDWADLFDDDQQIKLKVTLDSTPVGETLDPKEIKRICDSLGNVFGTFCVVHVENVSLPDSIKKELKAGMKFYGAYDSSMDKVHIYAPNMRSIQEVVTTYMHEVIGHQGMAKMLGAKKYKALCKKIGEALTEEQKKKIAPYLKESAAVQGDEYIAAVAETMIDEEGNIKEQSIWQRVKSVVRYFFERLFGIPLSDTSIQYMLWQSAHYMHSQSESYIKARQEFTTRLRALMSVIHTSKANFDGEMFDHHSFLGTGQGAQSHGWGTYLTNYIGVAQGYWDQFSDIISSFIEGNIMSDPTKFIEKILKENVTGKSVSFSQIFPDAQKGVYQYIATIPEEDADNVYLHEDNSYLPVATVKLLMKNSKLVANMLSILRCTDKKDLYNTLINTTGKDFFYIMHRKYISKYSIQKGPQILSEQLRDCGILGMKVPSGKYREKGIYGNIVMFRESDISTASMYKKIDIDSIKCSVSKSEDTLEIKLLEDNKEYTLKFNTASNFLSYIKAETDLEIEEHWYNEKGDPVREESKTKGEDAVSRNVGTWDYVGDTTIKESTLYNRDDVIRKYREIHSPKELVTIKERETYNESTWHALQSSSHENPVHLVLKRDFKNNTGKREINITTTRSLFNSQVMIEYKYNENGELLLITVTHEGTEITAPANATHNIISHFQKLYNVTPEEVVNAIIHPYVSTLPNMDVKKIAETWQDERFSLVTIAPYYNTVFNSSNTVRLTEEAETKFLNTAYNIASVLGINIDGAQSNLGGYTDESAGQRRELSYTFQLPGIDRELEKLWGCLVSDLGFQVQDSLIHANYLTADSQNYTGIEYTLRVEAADKHAIASVLEESGLDYTIYDGGISLLYFGNKEQLQELQSKQKQGQPLSEEETAILQEFLNFAAKIKKVAEELNATVEEDLINSDLIDTDSRLSFYKKQLTDLENEKGTIYQYLHGASKERGSGSQTWEQTGILRAFLKEAIHNLEVFQNGQKGVTLENITQEEDFEHLAETFEMVSSDEYQQKLIEEYEKEGLNTLDKDGNPTKCC